MNPTDNTAQNDDLDQKMDQSIQETITLKMLTRLINEMTDEEVAKVNELENDPDAIKAFLEETFGKEYMLTIAQDEANTLKQRLSTAEEASKAQSDSLFSALEAAGVKPEDDQDGSLD